MLCVQCGAARRDAAGLLQRTMIDAGHLAHFESWRRRHGSRRIEDLIELLSHAAAAGFEVNSSTKPWLTTICGARVRMHDVRAPVVVNGCAYLRVGAMRPESLNVVVGPGRRWLFILPCGLRPKRYLYLTTDEVEEAAVWPTPDEVRGAVLDFAS